MTIRSNNLFLRNLVQRFVRPPSLQNYESLRDGGFHSPQNGRPLQGILDRCSKSQTFVNKLQRIKMTEKNDNAAKYSLVYIFLIPNSRKCGSIVLLSFKGALLWQVHLWYHRIVESCCSCRKNLNI